MEFQALLVFKEHLESLVFKVKLGLPGLRERLAHQDRLEQLDLTDQPDFQVRLGFQVHRDPLDL